MAKTEDNRHAIAVLGAGAWGTALAQMLASDGRDVLLWAFEDDVVTAINARHINSIYLPDYPLSPQIKATSDIAPLADYQVILAVTPAQHLRGILGKLPASSGDLVLCSKGIEDKSGALMEEVARQASPERELAILSGPTFAHEIAAGRPGAVTLACSSKTQWDRLSDAISRPHFRPYYSDDIIGAEIGGAVKNVLAIACGVVDGMDLGQNARAALISRGFAEMTRFGLAMGAQAETLAGLSGLGDLVLTCSSTDSRNFSLGRALGEGQQAKEILSAKNSVAEGAFTAPVLQKLAKEKQVDMPIVDAVCALLSGSHDAQTIVGHLLARPLKAE